MAASTWVRLQLLERLQRNSSRDLRGRCGPIAPSEPAVRPRDPLPQQTIRERPPLRQYADVTSELDRIPHRRARSVVSTHRTGRISAYPTRRPGPSRSPPHAEPASAAPGARRGVGRRKNSPLLPVPLAPVDPPRREGFPVGFAAPAHAEPHPIAAQAPESLGIGRPVLCAPPPSRRFLLGRRRPCWRDTERPAGKLPTHSRSSRLRRCCTRATSSAMWASAPIASLLQFDATAPEVREERGAERRHVHEVAPVVQGLEERAVSRRRHGEDAGARHLQRAAVASAYVAPLIGLLLEVEHHPRRLLDGLG